MPSVRTEVEKLLGEMMVRARELGDPDKERETTEIAAIVLANSMPDITPDMPASLISAYARTTLSRAWMTYAHRRLAGTA